MADAALTVAVLLVTFCVQHASCESITLCLDSSCEAKVIIPLQPDQEGGDVFKDNILRIIVNDAASRSQNAENVDNIKLTNSIGDVSKFLNQLQGVNSTSEPQVPQWKTITSTASPWWLQSKQGSVYNSGGFLDQPRTRSVLGDTRIAGRPEITQGPTSTSTGSPWWRKSKVSTLSGDFLDNPQPHRADTTKRLVVPEGKTTTSTASPWRRQAKFGTIYHSGGLLKFVTTSRPRYYTSEDSIKTVDISSLFLTGEWAQRLLASLGSETTQDVREVRMSYNLIRDLSPLFFPAGLEYGLERLHLDHNPLRLEAVTRFELSRLHRLIMLNLSFTELKNFSEFPYLPDLRELDLSHNKLTCVPPLDRLSSLAVLRLSGNSIVYLPPLIDLGLSGLSDLYLDGNSISWVEDDAFKSMGNLFLVDLSNNSMQEAAQVVSAPAKQARLGGNPWHCDCAFVRLTQHMPWDILDEQHVKCLDGDVERDWPLGSLRSLPRMRCVDPKPWVRRAGKLMENIGYWWHTTGPSTFLLVVLVIVVGVLVALMVTRLKNKKNAPLDLPYTNLDQATVDG